MWNQFDDEEGAGQQDQEDMINQSVVFINLDAPPECIQIFINSICAAARSFVFKNLFHRIFYLHPLLKVNALSLRCRYLWWAMIAMCVSRWLYAYKLQNMVKDRAH